MEKAYKHLSEFEIGVTRCFIKREERKRGVVAFFDNVPLN